MKKLDLSQQKQKAAIAYRALQANLTVLQGIRLDPAQHNALERKYRREYEAAVQDLQEEARASAATLREQADALERDSRSIQTELWREVLGDELTAQAIIARAKQIVAQQEPAALITAWQNAGEFEKAVLAAFGPTLLATDHPGLAAQLERISTPEEAIQAKKLLADTRDYLRQLDVEIVRLAPGGLQQELSQRFGLGVGGNGQAANLSDLSTQELLQAQAAVSSDIESLKQGA